MKIVLGLLLMCLPALAHHGTGTYDNTNPVTLSGTVTEFAFTNPHAALIPCKKDAAGKNVNWAIEMNSPGVLRRAGWTKATFKARRSPYHGDAIEGWSSAGTDHPAHR